MKTSRSVLEVPTRRWTRLEYERMVAKDIFGPDDRIELIDGELVVKEPQHSPHATAILLVQDALRGTFGRGWSVRSQMPVALDKTSEPEPDVVVVRGGPRDYTKAHPAKPVLVVEVSLSRLAFDRRRKGSLYARAGLPDYWIVNVPERVLEVYREPVPSPAAPYGWKYRSVRLLRPRATVSPLASPRARIRIADLLP